MIKRFVAAGVLLGCVLLLLAQTNTRVNNTNFTGVASWSSSGTTSPDTGFSRDSAGVMDVGNGSQGDKTGSLLLAKVNKVTITTPAAGSTLTIADGKTLTASNSLTFAGTDGTTQTFQASDTIVGRTTTDTLTNKTLTAPVIGTTTMSEAPRMAFGGFYAGPTTGGNATIALFVTDKPVTVVHIEAAIRTAGAGCTTSPVFQVSDGTTAVTLTIPNASNQASANVSQNYGNASLVISMPTSAAGCGTAPADINIIVEYKMQ